MTTILMVCLGNICRSPLAEGILKSKLPSEDFFVDSAGTSGYHEGEKPDLRSIEVALKNGLDISKQKSRRFIVEDFETYDYIYVMDHSNYNDVVHLARNTSDTNKVKLILEHTPDAYTLEVPDPYYGGNRGFDNVYELLDNACNQIAIALTCGE
ncbi:MAG: low molecular weight phosphotyrosine protein phosphatase [Flavobacteriaceae bacterium]|nr:low molecular weight phosphotyrosine protein phosphatase [Flavobacteriaceae bacterium]